MHNPSCSYRNDSLPSKCTSGYRFGFNGQEKDDEIKGSGNSYSFSYRIYDSRLGRFLSVDPIAPYFPWLSTFQFAGNNPILNIDLEGLEPHSSHKIKMRTKPKISNDFTGRNLFDKLIGNDSRGKYTTNVNHHNNRLLKPQPDDNGGIDDDDDLARKKDKPLDTSNPLDRNSRHGEDIIIDNRQEYIPQSKEGTLNINFEQAKDADGNPLERTIEIGVVTKDGKEKVLNRLTTKDGGTLSSDFKLGEGEVLYKREAGASGNSNTSATKKTEEKKE